MKDYQTLGKKYKKVRAGLDHFDYLTSFLLVYLIAWKEYLFVKIQSFIRNSMNGRLCLKVYFEVYLNVIWFYIHGHLVKIRNT